MRRIILAGTVGCCLFACWGMNELGPLEEARKGHPAVFVPGNVLRYAVNGVDGYVFNGEAEQLFEGNLRESDAELFREALEDARGNLCRWLTKGDGSRTVELRGVTKLYEYVEGKMYRVVCFMPVR